MRIKRKVMALPSAQDAAERPRNEPVFDSRAVFAPRTKWHGIVLSKVPYANGGVMFGSAVEANTVSPGTGTESVASARPGKAPGVGIATTSHAHTSIVDGLVRESASRGIYGHSAITRNVPEGQVVEEPQDIPV